MYEATRLTEHCGGARIWIKREDLAHTGAHKINNALGQCLLAKRIGKPRIIAETGAGQHGVATATACALLGLECVVYMGAVDVQRQALNVFRMKMLGATVEVQESKLSQFRNKLLTYANPDIQPEGYFTPPSAPGVKYVKYPPKKVH